MRFPRGTYAGAAGAFCGHHEAGRAEACPLASVHRPGIAEPIAGTRPPASAPSPIPPRASAADSPYPRRRQQRLIGQSGPRRPRAARGRRSGHRARRCSGSGVSSSPMGSAWYSSTPRDRSAASPARAARARRQRGRRKRSEPPARPSRTCPLRRRLPPALAFHRARPPRPERLRTRLRLLPSDRPAAPGAPVDAEAASASAVSIRLSFDTSAHVAELVVIDRIPNKS